jgi:LacI family transcriptional regulator
MKTRPRISDIAERSGVSLATVSLVLNEKPGVSQETRDRVIAVAAELQYALPVRGASLANPCPPAGSPNLTTIGMLVKIDVDMPPQANPFYSKVILGIEEACRRSGINLMFATVPVDECNRPTELPALLSSNLIDGLLLVGVDIDESLKAVLHHNGRPLVLVDGYSSADAFDRVVSDNFHAAYQAVEYLLAKSHRHIALAGGEICGYPSIVERRAGYIRALKDHGIAETYSADFNINRITGQAEIAKLLQENPHITALFCVNDEVANAALRAAFDLGRIVPDDLSIIGYDDTYLASGAHPPLSTMRVDTVALGRAAVHLLSLRVENPDSARMTLTIHPTLVERESAAECKSHS